MSSLQMGLAMAGGLLLAAVVAHGAWQSRKNRLLQAQPEPEGANSDPQIEPVLDTDATPSGFERPPTPRGRPSKRVGLDALIDALVPVALDGVVSGDAVLAALPPSRRVGSKSWAVEGLNISTGQWEAPQAGHRYQSLQAGVQLANRTGPLNEIEYSEFVLKVQNFADAVNGAPDFPEMIEQVQHGRELDQFASSHDAQLSFTLRAGNAAWSPGYVQQHAARLGFVPGSMPGRMVMPSQTSGMPPILFLSFSAQAALAEDLEHSALREVTLSLDVPQVSRSEQPFLRMRAVAHDLSTSMDGLLTDDNGHPLPEPALDHIGQDLDMLYDTLELRDLAAGSPQARRLFS